MGYKYFQKRADEIYDSADRARAKILSSERICKECGSEDCHMVSLMTVVKEYICKECEECIS